MPKTTVKTKNYLSQNINTSKLEKTCCRKVKSYLKGDTYKFTIEKYVGFQKVELGWLYYQNQVISVGKKSILFKIKVIFKK